MVPQLSGLPDEIGDRIKVDVEICCRQECELDLLAVKQAAMSWLSSVATVRYTEGPISPPPGEFPVLDNNVESIKIVDLTDQAKPNCQLLAWDVAWEVHVYQLDAEGAVDDDEGEDNTPSYREWVLPSQEFAGSWDALYYDTEIKQRLLRFASSALLFAEAGVNTHLISWNRVVLLHGPPGTGKTSLCKALAQKLTVRLGHKYLQGQLIEVNAHSLFSKWFSESGKLVSRLFAKIQEAVEEEDNLVFVLIDEVESLTAARKAAVSGSEPADAIRAVNALLTQLDQLKAFPNVMVLTTSNITEAIDLAFVDRADIKAYIGPPTQHARYEILRSCMHELSRAGIITGPQLTLPSYREAAQLGCTAPKSNGLTSSSWQGGREQQPRQQGGGQEHSGVGNINGACRMEDGGEDATQQLANTVCRGLVEVSAAAEGLSGRTLRKLPFLAHAHGSMPGGRCGALQFVSALRAAVGRELQDRTALVEKPT